MESQSSASSSAPSSPALRRILREARELEESPSDHFCANPLKHNLFEWHFTLRGPDKTPFETGRYHGRLLLPHEYPFKPPSIYLLTPNGRFEVGKKICLSVSAHHPESWQPAWGIRTILTALIGFIPTKADGALAGLDYTDGERRQLAQRSLSWSCAKCGACMANVLADPPGGVGAPPPRVPEQLRFTADEKASHTDAREVADETKPCGAAAAPAAPAAGGAEAAGECKPEAPATEAAELVPPSPAAAHSPAPPASCVSSTPAAAPAYVPMHRELSPAQAAAQAESFAAARRRRASPSSDPLGNIAIVIVALISFLVARKYGLLA